MTIKELIDELEDILETEGEDPEINEYWIRVLTGVGLSQYIKGRKGLYLVEEVKEG
jgi:hypothetical protein